MKVLSLLAVTILAISCSVKKSEIPYVVKTDAGYIKGSQNGDSSVYIYRGVPFAAPPVGNLRWKAPQPHSPWTDTLECTAFGASPVQSTPRPFAMWTEEFIAPPTPLSEDCLFLNIWSPKHNPTEKLPVMVWIYGGGFVSGSSACAVYDGEALAKSGIVYVSINYRVSIFGFFSHPDLTTESPDHASGNYALLDQIAALKWINKNISAFGGDPSKVTIAGQSAGSISVQSLVASPLTKGLVSGAIAHSGGITERKLMTLKEAEEKGVEVATKANATSIDQLRQLPADSILKLAGNFPYGTFAPTVDGYVLPEHPNAIFAARKHNDIPMITGWVTGDASMATRPKTPKEFNEFAKETYGASAKQFMDLFPAPDDSIAAVSQSRYGLMQFVGVPAYKVALAGKSKNYMYEYSYIPTDKPDFPNYGAFHTSDVPFALHTLALWNRPWVEADLDVEAYMSSYWVNFVKTGNPNGNGLPEWAAYDTSSGVVMHLGATAQPKPGLYKTEFEFLAKER